jgi:peptidyl-prolyl cis-trans isomerase B (cyclophilin B)
VLVVVAVVVGVVIGFVAIGLLVGSSSTAARTSGKLGSGTPSTPSSPTPASPSVPLDSPTAGGPTNLPALSCVPPPPLPKHPQQFPKPPSPSLAKSATWRATLKTNCGPIVIDLNGKAAPQTVASFIFLSQQGFFNDSPCHRLVVQGIFVLQCGDPTGTGSGGPGYSYGLENAPANGDYPPGTVAMARTSDPNSNGSQFFIVFADTKLPAPGYSIFGQVVKGLPLVEAIAAKGVASNGESPNQPISILSASVAKL